MKKMIVLIGLFASMAALSSEIIKMPMQDFFVTDMDAVFEYKTPKFDKVLLDCQSLRMGMSFSKDGVMVSDIYLNERMCSEMFDFFYESKQEKLPVCVGLDTDNNELLITRETEDCI
jgi:hypothetical protein